MKAAILAVSLLTSFSFCSAASAQLIKLTIGSNTLSGSGLPAWIAKDAGIFRKNGLDVQIVYFRGGTITAMALVARETPIGQVTGPPIVSAGLKGADAVMIAGGNVVSEYWLMSRPEIKTAAQLKGGSVAIANFGGQADFLSRIALQTARTESFKGCHHRTDRHDPGAPERPGDGKSSGRHAQLTGQLQSRESGLL